MSFVECLIQSAGENDVVDGQELANTYKQIVADNIKEGMSRQKAEVAARQKMFEQAKDDAFYAREVIDNATKFNKILEWIDESGLPAGEAIAMRLEMIDNRIEAEKMKVSQILAEVQEELKVNIFGNRPEGVDDAIGEMLNSGKFDNTQLGRTAQALRRASSMMEADYIAAGGYLSPRKNFLPDNHNPARLRKRKKGESVIEARDRWVDFLLQHRHVTDPKTGELVTDPELQREIAIMAYDRIKTRGRSDNIEAMVGGDFKFLESNRGFRSYAKKRTSPKIFHAKSYESWKAYNTEYGVSNSPVDAILANMNRLARETAVLKELGSNPNAVAAALKDIIADSVEDSRGIFTGLSLKVSNAMIDSKFQILTAQGMYHESDFLDTFVTGTAHLTRANTLGMGGASAIPDIPLVRATAVFSGLDATRIIKNYGKILAGGGKEEREIIRRTGYLTDVITGELHRASRDSGLIDRFRGKQGKMQTLSSAVNTLSGLNRVTHTGRMAAHLETVTSFAEKAQTKWNDLDVNFRATLIESGIKKSEWDLINKYDLDDITLTGATGRVRAIDTAKMRALDLNNKIGIHELADKIDAFSVRMQNMATNEGTLTTKAITQSGDPLTRTLKKGVFMYKTFPITVLVNHSLRALKKGRFGRNMWSYRAHTLVGTTIFGYFSLTMKDLLNGKLPRDPSELRTLGASFLAGGGMGLYAEFFNPRNFHYGSGGPIFSMLRTPITDIYQTGATSVFLGASATMNYIAGDTDQFEKDWNNAWKTGGRTFEKAIPLKNIWFGSLLFERTFLDAFRDWLDPDRNRTIKRGIRKLEKETGQKYYWKPGEEFPGFEEIGERFEAFEESIGEE